MSAANRLERLSRNIPARQILRLPRIVLPACARKALTSTLRRRMAQSLPASDRRTIRVLHVISGLDRKLGGPPIALAGLAAAQAKLGLEVTVLSTFNAGEDASAAMSLEELGIPLHLVGPCSGPLSRHPELVSRLAKLIRHSDIVHIHGMWEEVQYQAAKIARRFGVPYIFLPQGMLDPWSLRQGRMKKQIYMALRLRKLLNEAAAIHCTSELEKEGIEKLSLSAPVIVEPLGLDLSEFQTLPEPGFLRTRYRTIGGKPIVLFLGRLHPKKGLPYLIEAMARVRRRDAVLVVAGPDSDGHRREMEQRAHQSGIGDRVVFTGFIGGADRIAAMVDADLFVLCSHQENFGIAVAESLAAGTPVIVSDQVHIHREVVAGQVGGVVPVDVKKLTAELDRWLIDEHLRAQAASRARDFAWQRWDWEKIADRLLGHYQNITATGRPAAPASVPTEEHTRRAA